MLYAINLRSFSNETQKNKFIRVGLIMRIVKFLAWKNAYTAAYHAAEVQACPLEINSIYIFIYLARNTLTHILYK